MRIRRPLILLIATAVLAGGCSSSNSDAPLPGEAHPAAWLTAHAAAATSDLDGCRSCHGSNLAGSGDAVSCFSCHVFNAAPPFTVHPADWDAPYLDHPAFAAVNGFASCAIAACHGTDQPFPLGGETAPSCGAATFEGRSCHADGPAPHALPFTDPADHGPEAKADLAYCQLCHGTPGTILFDGGDALTSCSDCHQDADAHPTRWQGGNDVTPDYLSSHRSARNLGTACAICHNVLAAGTGPHSGAPSCFSAGFTNADGVTSGCHADGPGVGHVLPFTDPTDHGPEAKADLTFCQTCHADLPAGSPGSDPRFNVAVGSLVSGCEDCHNDLTAHPAGGGRDAFTWYNQVDWTTSTNSTHSNAANVSNACGLCHGADLSGSAGPGCGDCHGASPVTYADDCVSCHNLPPDEQPPTGAGRPNRSGEHNKHSRFTCSTCHDNGGLDTPGNHFDGTAPANVTPPNPEITFTSTVTDTTCNGACHYDSKTKNHNNDTWYD